MVACCQIVGCASAPVAEGVIDAERASPAMAQGRGIVYIEVLKVLSIVTFWLWPHENACAYPYSSTCCPFTTGTFPCLPCLCIMSSKLNHSARHIATRQISVPLRVREVIAERCSEIGITTFMVLGVSQVLRTTCRTTTCWVKRASAPRTVSKCSYQIH